MKLLFKYLFNIVKNISLFIVLTLSCIVAYLVCNKEEAPELFSYLQQKVAEGGDHDDNVGMMAIDEQSVEVQQSKRVKIHTKEGFAYLRPSQIMHIKSDNPNEIKTTKEVVIKTDQTLTELENLLQGASEDDFFRVKSDIFNCNYIQQIITKNNGNPKIKYSYQSYVVMEDGDSIKISGPKKKGLSIILDEMAF